MRIELVPRPMKPGADMAWIVDAFKSRQFNRVVSVKLCSRGLKSQHVRMSDRFGVTPSRTCEAEHLCHPCPGVFAVADEKRRTPVVV